MYTIRKFNVVPNLPEKLRPLLDIANNLWWCWNHEAIQLFHRLDRELWETVNHNPVQLLGSISQERLHQRAEDDGYVAAVNAVHRNLQNYIQNSTWYHNLKDKPETFQVAYFSMEFGINECLPNYSGGLGVLAGDHLKSASDLGIPMVGVTLFYTKGYLQQYLNVEGWQQEAYNDNDPHNMPITLVKTPEGQPLELSLQYPDGVAIARVWKIQVGRVPLYLLDTNLEKNSKAIREITANLYGGDSETRIRQELLLGIGGMRALRQMGYSPTVCHINEGHSAFLSLERIRILIEELALPYNEALELVKSSNVFTTHTSVAAGIDEFSPQLVQRYLSPYLSANGIDFSEVMKLGRRIMNNWNDNVVMPIFALRTSAYRNAVSKLHQTVSQKLWNRVWPDLEYQEVPIDYVTNGIHTPSWISWELKQLLDRYLGPRWTELTADQKVWDRLYQIPDAELWRTHERRRERLVSFCRTRVKKQLESRGALPSELAKTEEILDPEALTIGFARRFATYKRAQLLFDDLDRLKNLLSMKDRPIQFIFAGKAHPKDEQGKKIISEIVKAIRQEPFRHSMVFLENYDMNIARYMVQGVDIWLNTPRRPNEASGTSGMKAAVNGALNLSILDGWWEEGFEGDNGFAIGKGEDYADFDYQDKKESSAIYDILESEILHAFYARSSDGVPKQWLLRMKHSMNSISPFFNTHRMVSEYTTKFYLPAANRINQLLRDNGRIKELVYWKAKIEFLWPHIKIIAVNADTTQDYPVESNITVTLDVFLPNLAPEDITAEIYYGLVDANGALTAKQSAPMTLHEKLEQNEYRFIGQIPCSVTGVNGYTVRVLPNHPDLLDKFDGGLIVWA